MSLAALLNLGKKEEEDKPKKPPIDDKPIPPIEEAPAIVERNREDLNLLSEYIGKQTEVSSKAYEEEEKQRQAERKRSLDEAVQQATRKAKLQKAEALFRSDRNAEDFYYSSSSSGSGSRDPKRTLCKFFFMAGASNAGCFQGDNCMYSHDIDSVL